MLNRVSPSVGAWLWLAISAGQVQVLAQQPTEPSPMASLHTYLTANDYPVEALRRGEEGTVSFRLSIGVDGRVTGCTITGSSGSRALDSATCRIMTERAGFTPATDENGRAVPGTFERRITWKLDGAKAGSTAVPASVDMATTLWFACTQGEAAKLALSDLAAPEVAERIFAACLPLEQRVAAEIEKAQLEGFTASTAIPQIRNDVMEKLPDFLAKSRSVLSGNLQHKPSSEASILKDRE